MIHFEGGTGEIQFRGSEVDQYCRREERGEGKSAER
jgi:hypothetical protein